MSAHLLRIIGVFLFCWATWRINTAEGVQVRLCVLGAAIGVIATVAGELIARPLKTWE